jgi:C-terminal processing protease CtpA/Prc
MVKRLILLIALALPVAASEALVDLAKVWSAAKYQHPWTLQRELDLDGMLVRAIPNVRAAKNDAEAAKAIGGMLAELGDPGTRVVETKKPSGAKPAVFRKEGDTLIVNLGPYSDAGGRDEIYMHGEALSKEIAAAKAVVFDVRVKGIDETSWIIQYLSGLVGESVPPLPMHGVFHSGYAPQQGTTSGGYYSAIQTTLAGALAVRAQAGAPANKRLVFVSSGDTLPLVAAALWFNGKAAIVSEKPLNESASGSFDSVELSDTHRALIRTGALATTGLAADAVVPRGSNDATMQKAIELANATTPLPTRPAAAAGAFTPHRVIEKPYPDMHYPDQPHRLLALFRLWSVIDTFYPYKHLIGDWDAVLREFIPRFESAKDEVEYAAAVLEAVARVEDGHSGASGHRAVNEIIGHWTMPVSIRYVGGQYVVAEKRGNFVEGTPLAIGDVIVSIDGEPIEERVKRFWKYRTASTEAARRNGVVAAAARGPKESIAKLGIRNDDGTTRIVDVPRVPMYVPPPEPKDLPYKVLEGNIGYVDLMRLTTSQVDAMFDALMQTKAIVFDLRGYPRGTAWPISPRINTKKAKYGASFRRVQLPNYGTGGFYFLQELPTSDKPVYQGKTVMLIDDRTISQAEHTGLFFEAANGTKFIGSNTAGANGDVTNFPLPGGFTVGFTGHDVRHADDRQLQRIGLVPDVRVEPTVKGIREGKDEVLARAIAYINTGQ